ncbi:Serine protease V8 [Phytophthora palmivora]|uniref:Serine protease n=1 Tax=Phytophthora palmivora TaxID=4796 RepID=A0A2P4X8E5_9STRA|nr:Serine protease V8 [Phytophthora palmivora]
MTRLLFQALASVVALTAVSTAQYANSSDNTIAGVEEEHFGVGCGDDSTAQPRYAYLVTNPLAQFISVHFKDFNLPDTDYVQVRAADPAAKDSRVLQYRGNDSTGAFYSDALSTSSVIVELYTDAASSVATANSSECVGFAVDNYQFLGQGSTLNGSKEEVCGADNSREARCYSGYSNAFQASNAVARLLIKKATGSFFCTGWLIGSEGHLLTNHHCISTQAHASNTEFEFMAEGSSCNVNCAYPRACGGTIRASYSTLIYADAGLDYALVKLPINLSWEYGYLRLRSSGAVMNERVYVPQHPSGWGKRIAIKTDDGFGTVTSLTMGGCASNQVAYYSDTQGGSSGSPVLAWSDNSVIALHHCGGCPNTAINSYKLVNDMRWRVAFTATCASAENNSNSITSRTAAGVEKLSFGVGCGGDMEYPPTDEFTEQPRFAYLITHPLADFVAVHFKDFNLPRTDYVQVRPADPASSETRILRYRGNETSGAFFSTALSTTAVIVELLTFSGDLPQGVNASQCVGFSVDSYQFMAQGSTLSGSKEEVCGLDNSREAACFKSFTSVFQASNAVVRLLIKKSAGAFFCTGWLIGSEGHLITNHHCISSQDDANNTEFEFDAEGSACNQNCASARACSGSIRAKTASFIYADEDLDYALVKLPENLSNEYGYLQLRSSGAVLNERVYLPQHPSGWGKRIAMKSDRGWGTVASLNMGGCSTDQVAYYLDTQGGSSGSPVISWSDNLVTALHHCGGCPNTAINSFKLVHDMRWRGILPQNAAV